MLRVLPARLETGLARIEARFPAYRIAAWLRRMSARLLQYRSTLSLDTRVQRGV
jgi:hypothetical protein